MRIGIVIVAWNSGDELLRCVEMLVAERRLLPEEQEHPAIIVVDNASSDGSVDRVAARFGEEVAVLRLPRNEGFAYACNAGAKADCWDYILFLNPDTEFGIAAVFSLAHELEAVSRKSIGIIGPQLVDTRGDVWRSCSRFPSVLGIAATVLKLPLALAKPTSMREWDHSETRLVDQIIGAALMIRGSVFRSLHGFDERFFVYYEEVDLCLRARGLGYKCLYYAEARGVHTGGGSSNQIRVKRLFYVWRSRLLFARKHFPVEKMVAACVFTGVVEPLTRMIGSLCLGRWADVWDLLFVWRKTVRWFIRSRGGVVESENRVGI